MGLIYSDKTIAAKSATYTYTLTDAQKLATNHQVSLEPSNGATGTVAVTVRAFGRTTFEPLTDKSVSVVIDLADARTAYITGAVEEIKLTPSNIVGSFTPAFSGWN